MQAFFFRSLYPLAKVNVQIAKFLFEKFSHYLSSVLLNVLIQNNLLFLGSITVLSNKL